MTPTADLMKQPFYNGTIEDFLRDHGICANDRKALVAALTASCDARDPWKCAYCGQINSPCALECSCCDQFKNHPTPAQPKASEPKPPDGGLDPILCDFHGTNDREELAAAHRAFIYGDRDHPKASEGKAGGEVLPVSLVEAFSKAIYEQWAHLPGYVPWVERGNSDMQCKARRILHAAMTATLTAPGADDVR